MIAFLVTYNGKNHSIWKKKETAEDLCNRRNGCYPFDFVTTQVDLTTLNLSDDDRKDFENAWYGIYLDEH